MIGAGADPAAVQDSHAHIAKQLPILVKQYLSEEAGRLPRDNWISRAVRPLAAKIERLSPAVNDGGRSPQNSEYPWVAPDRDIIAPADYKFEFGELYSREGIEMIRIVRLQEV